VNAVGAVIGSATSLVLDVVVGLVLIGAALAIFRKDLRLLDLASGWLNELNLFFAVGFTPKALLDSAGGTASLIQLALAATWWWLAFRDPDGRWRRRAKKASGVARDLGHRLVVVPTAAPAGT
jgi:hypothetical protein